MARRTGGLDDLRRAVARLDRLDDAVVRGASGPVLVDVLAVRDPARLLSACRADGLDLAALRSGLELRHDPRPLHAAVLARAHRDLRAIELSPEHHALILDAPRSLRRAVGRGADWLAGRRRRLDALRDALAPDDPLAALARHADDVGPDLAAIAARSPWLAAALDLAAAAHGEASARAALDLLRRSMSRGTGHVRDARRRADALLRRLAATPRHEAAGRSALDLALDEFARDACSPAPPRQRERMLRRAVLAALCWPAAAPADDPAPAVALPVARAGPGLADMSYTPDPAMLAALRRYADAALEVLHAPLDRAAQIELDAAVARAALAFPVDPGAPAWGRPELALARRLADLHGELAAPGLRLAQALWLARTELAAHARTTLAGWLAAGLRVADIEAVIACDRLDELLRVAGVDAAQRFCLWVTRLVPHYRQFGVDLRIEARQFAALPAGRRGELALLAHCLLHHEGRPTPTAVQRELALLDATLGLFRGVPQAARALLARLDAVPSGLGRARHPGFAAWLGDDDLLDRYCHLRQLLDEPEALSHNLRSDFEAGDRLARQVEHLRALAAPTEAQRQLLARLVGKLERESPRPDWTRRRLAEQVRELHGRAFRRQLDAALREVLRVAFGVEVPALTPTWRDVVRFYLGGDWSRRGADRNHQLLGDLLRAAARAPGRAVTRTWPKNQAWIDAARAQVDVDAWLRPRSRACRVGASACTLAVEDDPLEVLRMGVPFATCLSLRDGFNAASTVLNAVDVNKRVLYLRGEDGTILARQLLAVGADLRLLRYRLYSALSGADDAVVDELFGQVVQDIVQETGMVETGEGAPVALHGGFWYDDGALPALADDEIAAALAERDLPAPPRLERWERHHLRGLAALRRGDAAAALDLVAGEGEPLRGALARLAVAGLGESACRARAAHNPAAALALVLHALEGGGERRDPEARLVAALALACGLPPDQYVTRALIDADARLPSSGRLARAWLAAAERMFARGDDADDGIAHHAFRSARHLAALPIDGLLRLADRLEALWDRFVATNHYCADCRESAGRELALAAEAAFRRDPDPRPILRLLATGRPGLALRLALHLAARYPLERHVLKSMSLITCSEYHLQRGAAAAALARLERTPLPCPAAARALQELARRHPELAATDDFVAAGVRHRDPRRALDLPRPPSSPLPTCAELVLHAPETLAIYAEPDVAPSQWQPCRWELALQRRLATRWRRKLLRAAADGDPRAIEWAHTIGDPVGDEPHATRAALDLTAALVRGEALDVTEVAHVLRDRTGGAIDPAAGALAWRSLRDALGGRAPATAAGPALDLLLAAADDDDLPLAILDVLLESPRFPGLDVLAAAALAAVHSLRLLSARQIAGLWALPGARAPLLDFLLAWHRFAFPLTVRELGAATGDPAVVQAILTAWFARQAVVGAWSDDYECDPAERPLVLRAAVDGAGATGFLRVFDDATFTTQLEYMGALANFPPATRAALRDALAARQEPAQATAHFWLAHAAARP